MPGATELERLVVKLVGDGSDYTKVINKAVTQTKAGAKQIERAGTKVTQANAKAVQGAQQRYNSAGRAIDEYGRFVGQTTGKVNRLTGALSKAGSMAAATGKRMASIGKKMSLWITLPVVGASIGMLKLAGDAEQTKLAFEVMLGSAEKGQKLFSDLRNFAATTPFQFAGVTAAGKSLLAFGVQQEQLMGTMKMVGDVAAGTGKDFQELAVIYGQIRGMGRLQGQDFLQLVNAGFPVIEIAKTMGVSMKQLKKEMEDGNVSFEVVEKTFQRITNEGGVFANMMDRQSKTFLGMFSTFKDEVMAVATQLGTMLMPAAMQLLDWVRQAVAWFNQLSPGVKKFIGMVVLAAAAIGPLLMVLGGFIAALGPIIAVIKAITIAGVVLAAKIALIVAGVAALIAGFAWLVTEMFGADSVLKFFGDTWQKVKEYAANFFNFVIGFFANFRKNMKILVKWLGENWHLVFKDMGRIVITFIKNMIINVDVVMKAMFRIWTAWRGWMAGMFKRVFSVDFIKAVWAGIKKVGSIFVDFAKTAWKAIKSIFGGKKVSMSDFTKQMQSDFDKGMKDTNFLKTAGNIIKEEARNLKSPLDGFESSIKKGPQLALEWGEKTAKGLKTGMDAAGKTTAGPVNDIKEMSEEMKKLQEDITNFTAKMKTQIATFGMSSRAVEIWKLQTRGATSEQVALMRSLDKQLTALEKQKKMMEKGASITKQFRTPVEVFNDRQNELKELLDAGAINAETFTRAMEDAKKQLDKEYKAKVSVSGVEGVEAGTAEAMARLQEFASLRPRAGVNPSKPPVAAVAATGAAAGGLNPAAGVTAKQTPVAAGGRKAHEAKVEELLARIAIGVEDNTGITLAPAEV